MLRYLLLISLLLIQPAVVGQQPDLGPIVDKHAKPLEESGLVTGFVVVAVQRETDVISSFGRIARNQNQKPDGDTLYEIGSITKGMLTTVFADMVLDGTIKKETYLRDVLPKKYKVKSFNGVDGEYPIQLEHLAMHTAYLNDFPDDITPDLDNYNRDKIYAYLARYPTYRQPGAIFDYSNYGASVLGLALCEKSKKTYDDLFKSRLFAPLKMKRTQFRPCDTKTTNFAPPYDTNGKSAKPFPNSDLANLCGGIRSTGNDMLKFARACVGNDSKVSKAIRYATQARTGSFSRTGSIENLRGYSWSFLPTDGMTVIHPGDTFGYSSMICFNRLSRTAVVILCNTRNAKAVYELTMRVQKELNGQVCNPFDFKKNEKTP